MLEAPFIILKILLQYLLLLRHQTCLPLDGKVPNYPNINTPIYLPTQFSGRLISEQPMTLDTLATSKHAVRN